MRRPIGTQSSVNIITIGHVTSWQQRELCSTQDKYPTTGDSATAKKTRTIAHGPNIHGQIDHGPLAHGKNARGHFALGTLRA